MDNCKRLMKHFSHWNEIPQKRKEGLNVSTLVSLNVSFKVVAANIRLGT